MGEETGTKGSSGTGVRAARVALSGKPFENGGAREKIRRKPEAGEAGAG
jgi:hypothetical protein